MSRQRRQIACPRDPIGLSMDEAAAYIGVSAGTFMKAVENQLMPGPFELFGRRLWHAGEIDAAMRRLPRQGGGGPDRTLAKDQWDDIRV